MSASLKVRLNDGAPGRWCANSSIYHIKNIKTQGCAIASEPPVAALHAPCGTPYALCRHFSGNGRLNQPNYTRCRACSKILCSLRLLAVALFHFKNFPTFIAGYFQVAMPLFSRQSGRLKTNFLNKISTFYYF